MEPNKNLPKIGAIIGVVAVVAIAGVWMTGSKDSANPLGTDVFRNSNPTVSETPFKTDAKEIGTLSEEELKMSASAPMVTGTGSDKKELVKLQTAKTEFIEDYLRSLATATGALESIDEKKLMSLPAKDIVQLEMAFDFVRGKDGALMDKIARVLVNRETYGTVFREDSFEGMVKKAYLSKTPLDYAKLKETKVENAGNLGFITGEIFFSSQSDMLNKELLDALDYRISLLPKNSRSDTAYNWFHLSRTFLADVVSKEYLTPARSLREITVQGSPNFFSLENKKDIALVDEAETILKKYQKTNSLKEVKAVESFQADITKLEEVYKTMDSIPTSFKNSFRGLPALGYALASMYAIDGRPEMGLELLAKVGAIEFNGIDGVKVKPGQFLNHDFRRATIYEALGDKLVSSDRTKALEAYQNAVSDMEKWMLSRPHYPFPRAFVKRVEQKVANLK